jgi:hypothetical protein
MLLLKPSNNTENCPGNSASSFKEFLLWKSEEKVIPDRTCRAYGWMGVKSNRAVRPSQEKCNTWQSLRRERGWGGGDKGGKEMKRDGRRVGGRGGEVKNTGGRKGGKYDQRGQRLVWWVCEMRRTSGCLVCKIKTRGTFNSFEEASFRCQTLIWCTYAQRISTGYNNHLRKFE